MKLRLAAPVLLCLALPVTAAQDETAQPAPDPAEAEIEAAPAEFPADLWGVYGRSKYACRAKGFAVEGKMGIRENKLILEGQPFELGEIHRVTDRMIVADFVAPGGWSTKGVRMSFQLLRDNKLWHATFAGKPAPRIGYVRCPQRK